MKEIPQGKDSEVSVVYPCCQLLALLLLTEQVLGGRLQLKLGQLMLPAHRSEHKSTAAVSVRHGTNPLHR